MIRIAALIFSILLAAPQVAAAEIRLLMAEEAGCIYCARWNAEIGEIYPKTPEGAAAPLLRYDLHRDEAPAELSQRVRFTPTFILVRDGVELSRIEGYPGDMFFWGLLGMMLDEAGIPTEEVDDQ